MQSLWKPIEEEMLAKIKDLNGFLIQEDGQAVHGLLGGTRACGNANNISILDYITRVCCSGGRTSFVRPSVVSTSLALIAAEVMQSNALLLSRCSFPESS